MALFTAKIYCINDNYTKTKSKVGIEIVYTNGEFQKTYNQCIFDDPGNPLYDVEFQKLTKDTNIFTINVYDKLFDCVVLRGKNIIMRTNQIITINALDAAICIDL